MTQLANTIYEVSPSATLQVLGNGDGGVVLHSDGDQFFTINDTAVAFIQKLDGRRSYSEVVEQIAGEFEVGRSTLQTELEKFATQLERMGIICVSGATDNR